MACVYEIRNLINNKIYIGSAKNFEKRVKQHRYMLNSTTHKNKYLQNAWDKHSCQNFKFTILEECTNEDKYKVEQKYLDNLKPFGDIGYNIAMSAVGGLTKPKIKECKNCGDKFTSNHYRKAYCEDCKMTKYFLSLPAIERDFMLDGELDEEDYEDFEEYEVNNSWRYSKYESKRIEEYDVDDFIAAEFD